MFIKENAHQETGVKEMYPVYSRSFFISTLVFVSLMACQESTKGVSEKEQKIPETKVYIQKDTSTHLLKSCSTALEGKNITIDISGYPKGSRDYEISIAVKDGKFDARMFQPWMVTDCAYVVSRFKIIEQKIDLDKSDYNRGEMLSGNLQLLVLRRPAYHREKGEMKERDNWDTLRVHGVFGSKVE